MLEEKHYIVFWVGLGGDSESCNAYYSSLVRANDRVEAIEKFIAKNNYSPDHYKIEDFDAIPIDDKNYIG